MYDGLCLSSPARPNHTEQASRAGASEQLHGAFMKMQ